MVKMTKTPFSGTIERATYLLEIIHTDVCGPMNIEVLGNVAEIQNFLRITKINLCSNLATRGMGVHLHTLVDREQKHSRERG